MTHHEALTIAQSECDTLAAKYQLKSYVRTPKPKDDWGKSTVCQIIVGNVAAIDILKEILNMEVQPATVKYHDLCDSAFQTVAMNEIKKKQKALVF